MKQKFRATAISSNQLSFFSIFDIDEDEITQIVDSPKEHLNDAYTSGLNFKSDESNISEINYDSERRENHLYESPNYLKIRFCIQLILQQKQIIYIRLKNITQIWVVW